MSRRQFQISDSVWGIECRPLGWFVIETWQEIDRHGEKADEFELYGPHDTREAAQEQRRRMEGV